MNNEEKILEILVQMQSDMVDMKADMAGMKADMADMKTDMAGMKEQIDQIDVRSQRTAVLMETEVDRKLNLLYEGHGLIMESLDKLATKDRVEKLEDEIIVLKTSFKTMNQRIAELEKAQ
jgi:predicted  nucleic acid-binding Zn-ribbon protein